MVVNLASDRAGKRRLRLLVFVMLIVIWEVIGRQVSDVLLAPPSAVVRAFAELVSSGELVRGVLISLKSLLIGFGLSVLIGVPLGVIIGRFRVAAFLLEPIINAMYATPMVALIPIVMLWFGMGLKGKVFFIVLTGIFPIVINALAGVRNIDRHLIEVGRSFKASERQLIWQIAVPFALPYIMTGVRLGIGRGVVGMVLAEILAFEEGWAT